MTNGPPVSGTLAVEVLPGHSAILRFENKGTGLSYPVELTWAQYQDLVDEVHVTEDAEIVNLIRPYFPLIKIEHLLVEPALP